MFAAARTFSPCSFHCSQIGGNEKFNREIQGVALSLLSRKLTSSFSIFRVDKRDCSCWHLCTSSLWTGCWAQSWEACQKPSNTRSGRGHSYWQFQSPVTANKTTRIQGVRLGFYVKTKSKAKVCGFPPNTRKVGGVGPIWNDQDFL